MSQRQVDFFRRQLERWRELAEQETRNCHFELTRERDEKGDIIDQSFSLMAERLTMLNGQRIRNLITRIDAALERIEMGDYGYCLRSGEAIGLPRLLAWPIASLSIEAQEELERQTRRRCN